MVREFSNGLGYMAIINYLSSFLFAKLILIQQEINMKYKFSYALASMLTVLLTFVPTMTTHVGAGAISGSPPVTTIIPVDETFINDFDCAFPIVEQVTGSVRDTLYFDQNGMVTREYISPQFRGALTVTWTNPLTGKSLSSHQASSLIIYYNADGSFEKLMNQGLTFMVTVPGVGQPLLADVGRIVIERGQGITFEAGAHQELNGDTAAFCDYLADP
jgi:hypothetical protein